MADTSFQNYKSVLLYFKCGSRSKSDFNPPVANPRVDKVTSKYSSGSFLTPQVGEATILAAVMAFRIQHGKMMLAISLCILFNFIRKMVMVAINIQPLYKTHFSDNLGTHSGLSEHSKGYKCFLSTCKSVSIECQCTRSFASKSLQEKETEDMVSPLCLMCGST